MTWIFAGMALLLGVTLVVLYNRLVHDRERVRQAWSDILVQLKRRHDLIPKLVDAVRAYAGFEQRLLTDVTGLRGRADDWQQAPQRASLEQNLSRDLEKFLVRVEEYPELKASAQWLDLLEEISGVEETIQKARRYYNGAVKELNVRVDSFPSNLVAGAFGFRHAAFFELDTGLPDLGARS